LSRFLLSAGLIVFLNKQDLLEQKINQGRSIAPYFPAYAQFQSSGDEYTKTKVFIKNMFVVSASSYRITSTTPIFLISSRKKKLQAKKLTHHADPVRVGGC
jgi:hypothetical protein